MYNTPPAFGVYIVGLVAKWLLAQGGLAAIERVNERKAAKLYAEIDRTGFYRGTAAKEDRSLMNVTFRLASEELEKLFVKETTAAGLDGLKGHRCGRRHARLDLQRVSRSRRGRAGGVHEGVRTPARLGGAESGTVRLAGRNHATIQCSFGPPVGDLPRVRAPVLSYELRKRRFRRRASSLLSGGFRAVLHFDHVARDGVRDSGRCVQHDDFSASHGDPPRARAAPRSGLVFRFVLWLTTGITTREWVAVHRKHHAFTDEEGDPHSPYLEGFWPVQLGNVFYYMKEAKNAEVVEKYARDIKEDRWDKLFFNHGLTGLVLGIVILCHVAGDRVGTARRGHSRRPVRLRPVVVDQRARAITSATRISRTRPPTSASWRCSRAAKDCTTTITAIPRSPKFSFRPSEIDPAWPVIRMLIAAAARAALQDDRRGQAAS